MIKNIITLVKMEGLPEPNNDNEKNKSSKGKGRDNTNGNGNVNDNGNDNSNGNNNYSSLFWIRRLHAELEKKKKKKKKRENAECRGIFMTMVYNDYKRNIEYMESRGKVISYYDILFNKYYELKQFYPHLDMRILTRLYLISYEKHTFDNKDLNY